MADIREQSESVTNSNIRRRRKTNDHTHQHVHDIVCIGFGYNAISLAIALEETYHEADVLFLDRQSRSTHTPFTRLPGDFMQLSFLNDLVTLENPRSKFTFVNYLYSTDQLIQFTNLGSIQPLREQFARYLHWCANQFETNVQYGAKVQAVKPVRIQGSLVDAWSVEYIEVETKRRKTVIARQVVCADGPRPNIPSALCESELSTSLSHSSTCLEFLSALSKGQTDRYHIAVVGNGQEAAEIVDNICSMRNPHQVTWIQEHSSNDAGNIGHELNYRLYERQYRQRVQEPDPQRWAFQTHSNVSLKSASRSADGKIYLSFTNFDAESGCAGIVCDFIIAATGYEQLEFKQLLNPIRELFDRGELAVSKDRSVKLKMDPVEQNCGIWILGSNEHVDQSLAHIATTSRYLADSMKKKLRRHSTRWQQVQPRL